MGETYGVAELVGGPIDGQRFTVTEPPPYEWRRYASVDLAELITAAEPPVVRAASAPVERYQRDSAPRADGVWIYRWGGVERHG